MTNYQHKLETIINSVLYHNFNLVDVIAAERGWLPLTLHEEMRIHYDDKHYIIKRIDPPTEEESTWEEQ